MGRMCLRGLRSHRRCVWEVFEDAYELLCEVFEGTWELWARAD